VTAHTLYRTGEGPKLGKKKRDQTPHTASRSPPSKRAISGGKEGKPTHGPQGSHPEKYHSKAAITGTVSKRRRKPSEAREHLRLSRYVARPHIWKNSKQTNQRARRTNQPSSSVQSEGSCIGGGKEKTEIFPQVTSMNIKPAVGEPKPARIRIVKGDARRKHQIVVKQEEKET